jgi:choline-sulfatase
MAGPSIPAGRLETTNVSHVDCYPTILDCVGVERPPEDADLPGRSLFEILDRPAVLERSVFGEYHAEGSENGVFMIRGSRYKYIEYVNAPAQLFDLSNDPGEVDDLAALPEHAETMASCAAELRQIGDPVDIDRRAHEAQRRRIDEHGGEAAVRQAGYEVVFTPPPRLPGDSRPS